jgi:hypothetical protein
MSGELLGLAFGASMPNAATLITEYAPPRCRALPVMTVFCGLPFGADMVPLKWPPGDVFASLASPPAVGAAMVLLKDARHRGAALPVCKAAAIEADERRACFKLEFRDGIVFSFGIEIESRMDHGGESRAGAVDH